MKIVKRQKVRAYLAGKMTGLDDHGFAEFARGSKILKDSNRFDEVFDPSLTENGNTSKPRAYYMKIDLDYVVNKATHVVVLPNWKESPGALTEVRNAQETDKVVLYVDTLEPITEKVIAVPVNEGESVIVIPKGKKAILIDETNNPPKVRGRRTKSKEQG